MSINHSGKFIILYSDFLIPLGHQNGNDTFLTNNPKDDSKVSQSYKFLQFEFSLLDNKNERNNIVILHYLM